MIRALLTASFCAAALAAAVLPAPSRADNIVYVYTALPGPLNNCEWFNDHLSTDRSTSGIAQLVDLIYNRAGLEAGTPLQAGAPVTITGSATTSQGDTEKSFTYAGRVLCGQADIVTPATPVPPTPSPLPSVSP